MRYQSFIKELPIFNIKYWNTYVPMNRKEADI